MFHTCANLFQSRPVCQCEYMYVFVCGYCYASEWDCMRRIVKNDFNVVALSKMRTVKTSISMLLQRRCTTLPKFCQNGATTLAIGCLGAF